MVIPDDDWTLPPPPELIHLCCDELLVLDWVLCAASGLVQEDADPAFGWHETRLECWRQIGESKEDDNTSLLPLPLTQRDAKTLLRAVPTTLTWGDGVDHGFNLKMKLAKFLLGEDYAADNSTDQTASDPPDETPGAAPA